MRRQNAIGKGDLHHTAGISAAVGVNRHVVGNTTEKRVYRPTAKGKPVTPPICRPRRGTPEHRLANHGTARDDAGNRSRLHRCQGKTHAADCMVIKHRACDLHHRLHAVDHRHRRCREILLAHHHVRPLQQLSRVEHVTNNSAPRHTVPPAGLARDGSVETGTAIPPLPRRRTSTDAETGAVERRLPTATGPSAHTPSRPRPLAASWATPCTRPWPHQDLPLLLRRSPRPLSIAGLRGEVAKAYLFLRKKKCTGGELLSPPPVANFSPR